MPIITAYADHPTRPYVRVEINWADVPAATHAGVSRVDVETGECTPLRPYICYSGWELLLSCGHGTFWDTEAPFDRPFYYITESSEAPCVPAALIDTVIAYDAFDDRTLVNSWGSAYTGQTYTNTGGVTPDDYDVNSGFGIQTNQAVNTLHWSTIDVGVVDQDFTIDTMLILTAPTGAPFSSFAVARFENTANNLIVRLAINTDRTLDLDIRQFTGGAGSTVSPVVRVGDNHLGGDWWRIRVQAAGSRIRAKAWLRDFNSEPVNWQTENTSTISRNQGASPISGRVVSRSTIAIALSRISFLP